MATQNFLPMSATSQALSKSKQLLTSNRCQALLKLFSAKPSVTQINQVHAVTIASGLLSGELASSIGAVYGISGDVSSARRMFDELPEPSLFLYSTLIRMYVHGRSYSDAIVIFIHLVSSGKCLPDNYTFPFVFKACGESMLTAFGAVVHGRSLMAGFEKDTFVQNSLMSMYMSFGTVEAARKVFDMMGERSVVSWNSMISGYFKNGWEKEALKVFLRMVDEGVAMDCASALSVLPVCGFLKDISMGKKVHALMEENGLRRTVAICNALIDMYMRCGNVDEACLVFDGMVDRDVVTWTSMINGYILNGEDSSGLSLCKFMLFGGVRPNSVTLASLLSACGSLKNLNDARCLHAWAVKQKLVSDVIVETSLIDTYSKCNRMDLSFQIFMKSSKKRTAQWNAILSRCSHDGFARHAVELFKQMLTEELKPDDATLNSLLPAYAVLADPQQAMNLHSYLVRSGFLSGIEVATGLVDIYSKCGSCYYAKKIFDAIPKEKKDIFVWSVIIAGYGKHGHGKIAVSLFKQMIQDGIKPNEVTFTSVLHSCSHAGLVDEGLDLFKFMLESQLISPNADHYTCIVDLLGRCGRLDEAYHIISTMPFAPTHAIWGALLGACVIHENVEFGEVAAKWLFQVEPKNTGNYVLLAKIYAAVGRWRDAEDVRCMMNEIGLRKVAAHSWVGIR